MNEPRHISFKVSARTARLIGRENVSNADGAIIELIKNGHDADAKNVLIHFSDNELFIIDNGHGMTENIIEQFWMTIGTDNKAKNPYSPNNRVTSGAKGIGRFALDRLGHNAEMYTLSGGNVDGLKWSVDWDAFETDISNVSEINADLETIPAIDLAITLNDLGVKTDMFSTLKTGTILRISRLREDWNEKMLDDLFSSLEVLAAPMQDNAFMITMQSSRHPESYGAVLPYINNEFDLKIDARYSAHDQTVRARITRMELDVLALETEYTTIFQTTPMNQFPYTVSDFKKGYYDIEMPVKNLLKGFKDPNNHLEKVGDFDFTLIFGKNQLTSDKKEDADRYPYRSVDYAKRKAWFSKFGGIKLFRDNFRVRPYGEGGDDWLGLGRRQAKSPQGPGQGVNGYKFRPNQVAGTVMISRITNLAFEDKSSREGLQENETFDVFKNLLLGVIGLLEKDRSVVFTSLSKFYDETHESEKRKKEGRSLAANINTQDDTERSNRRYSKEETETLAGAVEELDKDNKRKDDEIRTLRSLASAGLITAATAHELKHLENQIRGRADELRERIAPFITAGDVAGLQDFENPYVFIKDMEKNDKDILDWLNYALMPLRRDRRKTQNIYLISYFDELKTTWQSILEDRHVTIDIEGIEPGYQVRMFPIDLDTLFNNLIVNSIESFRLVKKKIDRKIKITCSSNDSFYEIDYLDNGNGLDEAFHSDPSEIFLPQTTSKRDESGNEAGTGMGMYLVKVIIDASNGDIAITKKVEGFSVKMHLPIAGVKND